MSIYPIGFQRCWLAAAAVAEANNLPLLTFSNQVCEVQLILARYTRSLISTGFIYEEIKDRGAMWTDSLTDFADETSDIAGFVFENNCAGIQVVRIGLPANYIMGNSGGANPITGKLTDSRWAREYWIRSNIPATHFANIPVIWDPLNRKFLKPALYAIPTNLKPPLLRPFAG